MHANDARMRRGKDLQWKAREQCSTRSRKSPSSSGSSRSCRRPLARREPTISPFMSGSATPSQRRSWSRSSLPPSSGKCGRLVTRRGSTGSLSCSSAWSGHRSPLTFAVWRSVEHTLSIHTIVTTRRELFYWAAILFTFALGTAAGDLATEALSLGFNLGVVIFGALIGLIAAAYALGADAVLTFWLAYILTRPLGASLGDLLSQSREYGGIGFGTTTTSLVFLTVIATLVALASVTSLGTKQDFEPAE